MRAPPRQPRPLHFDGASILGCRFVLRTARSPPPRSPCASADRFGPKGAEARRAAVIRHLLRRRNAVQSIYTAVQCPFVRALCKTPGCHYAPPHRRRSRAKTVREQLFYANLKYEA